MHNDPAPRMEYDDGLDGCRGFINGILYTSAIVAVIVIVLFAIKLLAGGKL